MPMGNEPHVADIVSTNIYLSSRPLALEYLRSIYPALRRHYDWFRRTQRGQIKQYARKARSRTEAYRWRGRTPTHILTSGMDDYPRGPPHAGELHLDLLSWMGFFSRTMKSIAEFLGEHEDAAMFTETLRGVVDNIDGGPCALTSIPGFSFLPQICIGTRSIRCIATLQSIQMVSLAASEARLMLTLMQMNRTTNVILVTCPFSHSCWVFFQHRRRILAMSSILSEILTTSGRRMGCAVCPSLILCLEKERTTGVVRSGCR